MHLVLLPLTLIVAAVFPHVNTFAVDIIFAELADEHGLVCPLEGSRAMLLSVLIVSFVAGIVKPSFDSVPVLLVFGPLSRVLGTIKVDVDTPSMGLIVEPVPFEHVPVAMNQSAPAVGHVVLPVALVLGTVLPDLGAVALSQAFRCPLTLVDCSVIKLVGAPNNQFLVISFDTLYVVLKRPQLICTVFSSVCCKARHFIKLCSINDAVFGRLIAIEFVFLFYASTSETFV